MGFAPAILGVLLVLGVWGDGTASSAPYALAQDREKPSRSVPSSGEQEDNPSTQNLAQCGDPRIEWGSFTAYFEVLRHAIDHRQYDFGGTRLEGCVLTMLVEARRPAQAGGLLVRMLDRDRVEIGLSPAQWEPDYNAMGWARGERARVLVPLEPHTGSMNAVDMLALQYQ